MRVIDSHTEGEPTRLILSGGPELGHGSMAERRKTMAAQFDHYRTTAINEPRGFDALVGALLCEPVDSSCAAGVIFFNNAGYLGMCGHASIGTAVSLFHLGRIGLGEHRLETPVGTVTVHLTGANTATIENVASYRLHENVKLDVKGHGSITGDIAWGGNWFFLSHEAPCALTTANIPELTRSAAAVKAALAAQGLTGDHGAEIDHVEFFGAAKTPGADSRNFVLCPGGAYDRSPCGTGTSAKLACLAASGTLKPGENWIQESIIGSRFAAHYRLGDQGEIIPSITGRAYICSEAMLYCDKADPFANGIPA